MRKIKHFLLTTAQPTQSGGHSHSVLLKSKAMKCLLTFVFATLFAGQTWATVVFDFSAVCSSGQTLYYAILSNTEPYTVQVTYPDQIYQSFNYTTYYYSQYPRPTGDLVIPSEVVYGGKTYSVISIGQRAFDQCSDLTSVTIPSSVKSIGLSAFYYCYGLESINIPSGVTSIGSGAFYYCPGLESITIPNSVTTIGSEAFYYCTGLTSINIPSSVTTIGSNAFDRCDNIETLTYNTNALGSTFKKLKSLKTVNIGDDVTIIDNYAFNECKGLTSITIPSSVTTIGNYAFKDCSGLKSATITIPSSVTEIGDYAFNGCYDVKEFIFEGETAPTFGRQVFGSTNMCPIYVQSFAAYEEYTTADNMSDYSERVKIVPIEVDGFKYERKGDGTFAVLANNYSGDVVIPSSIDIDGETIPVTAIGAKAFYNCSELTSISIPSSITSIGGNAFFGCTNMTTVTLECSIVFTSDNIYGSVKNVFGNQVTECIIGESVTTISSYAFKDCSGLKSLTIPSSVTSISVFTFNGCSIENLTYNTNAIGNAFRGRTSLKTVNIGDNVTRISSEAFSGCTGLTSITIPSNVTSISSDAFNNCDNLETLTYNTNAIGSAFSGITSLRTINIGNNVTSIGDNAFKGCTELMTITIPNNVTSIGNNAFDGCTNVMEFIFERPTAPSFGTSVFENTTGKIYVPTSAAVTKYKNASNMSSYASRVEVLDGIFVDGIKYVVRSDGNMAVAAKNYMGKIVIPESVHYQGTDYTVTAINYDAFHNCSNLKSVTIPNTVTRMEQGTFTGCTSLESISLPFVGLEAKTGEGKYQYPFGWIFEESSAGPRQHYCGPSTINATYKNYLIPSSLKEVTITNSSWIPCYSFENCTNLTAIIFECETLPRFGFHVFENTTCTIYVPTSADVAECNSYANISRYASRIEVNPICNIKVVANNSNYGSVTGGGTFDMRTTTSTTITAKANKNYRFISWSDGNTDATREITITGKATYKAIFKRILTVSSIVLFVILFIKARS